MASRTQRTAERRAAPIFFPALTMMTRFALGTTRARLLINVPTAVGTQHGTKHERPLISRSKCRFVIVWSQ